MSRAVRLVSLIATISLWSAIGATALAEESDTTALAAALQTGKATLQGGLRASKAQGTPISAKFEIEDGKLQVLIYTMTSNVFMEVVVDPKTGAVAKAQEITDAMDLTKRQSKRPPWQRRKCPSSRPPRQR